MSSQNQLLFMSLISSIRMNPGSAKSYVDDMITSPDPSSADGTVHAARHLSERIGDVAVVDRPASPHDRLRIVEVDIVVLDLRMRERERELPSGVIANRVHEFPGDQEGKVELAQSAVLALCANEVEDVRVANVEGGHLSTSASARRRDGETHPVVDVHERERPRRVRSGARDVCALGPQRGELVADAAAGLESEARLMHLLEDVVHRILDGPGYGAVDRRRRRFVFQRTGIRHDPPARNRTLAQRPQELFVPVRAQLVGRLDAGDGVRHATVGFVDAPIDDRTVAFLQPILACPKFRATASAAGPR